ncbi:BON domain-containing protein [Variovorax beijingensis]|uniref:BON domain-containing protein n=1 Tax=Variovorax beijingensis TaxID=2496117 RepID=UPI001CB8F4A2|nr:BON domain-containing protein [Variovorax beijingensis]
MKEGDAKSPQQTVELRREAKVQPMCADSVGRGTRTAGAEQEAPSSLFFFERFEMNPDIQLRHEVFAQLNWDPAVFGCDVDVRVADGVVTLRGQLASEDLKNAVERAVRRAEGVKRIVNQLTTAECASND